MFLGGNRRWVPLKVELAVRVTFFRDNVLHIHGAFKFENDEDLLGNSATCGYFCRYLQILKAALVHQRPHDLGEPLHHLQVVEHFRRQCVRSGN